MNIQEYQKQQRDRIAKSFSNDAFDIDLIEKGKKMPIGTVSGGYKKVAEGKWIPVKKEGGRFKQYQDAKKNAPKMKEAYGKGGAGKASKGIPDMEVVLAQDGNITFGRMKDGTSAVFVDGKKFMSGDFDRGADGWFLSKEGDKGQKGFDEAKQVIDHVKRTQVDSMKPAQVIEEAFKEGGLFEGKDTLDIYKEGGYYGDGEWTPKRKELHDNIVKNYLSKGKKPKGKVPVSIMMGGAPASGKSSVIKAGLLDVPDGLITIDADEMKAQLPEYKEMAANKDHRGAAFAHEESSYLSKRVLGEATGEGYGILMDGTGNTSPESVKKKVAMIKKAGHRVVANYVTLDLELSLKNNEDRFKKTGRKVPESYVKKVNKNIPNIVEKALSGELGFDELHLYDTNINGKPRKILEYNDGKLTMHDQALYDNFMKKKDIEL